MTYEMAMLMNWPLVASGFLASDLFSDLFNSNSRLRTHNQNITVAARMMAERKTVGLLS